MPSGVLIIRWPEKGRPMGAQVGRACVEEERQKKVILGAEKNKGD